MAMKQKQNLMPALPKWIYATIGLFVLFTIGLFEQRTKFVLDDGTVIMGHAKAEDDTTVEVERASGYVQKLEKARIKERNWFNIEVDLNLGLDLRGGTSLRYKLDIPETDPAKIKETLEQTVATFRKRLDSIGVKELSVVAAPPDQILIELPSVTMEESIAYEQVIQRLGTLQFLIVAKDALADNLDLTKEKTKVETAWNDWKKTNPNATPKSFELTKFDLKGVSGKTYRWYPYSARAIENGYGRTFPFEMLELDNNPKEQFAGDSIERVFQTTDQGGRPALGFHIIDTRGSDFKEFTTKYHQRQMAIVLDGEVHSAPNLNSPIETQGIIEGGARGFTTEELKGLISVFQSGSLKVTPSLLSKATIGPSLGEASIHRGIIAGVIASVLVIGFIVWYYGFVGILSALTLVLGIYYLLGGLGFLEATLTMPGIAGIVLTVGMAIDQNILINERIREERQKGKTIPQSIKNGFDRAFVTIFDAQATTFLTGAILYFYGTGPIKGFAVTLMLGIVVTMYAAIVGQKILFALGIQYDWFKHMNLRHTFANANVPFTKYFKVCGTASVVGIVGGLALFLADYDSLRGLDFVGGFQTRIQLTEPMTQGDVESKIGAVFEGAQVVSMAGVGGATNAVGGSGRDFLIKIRADRTLEGADSKGDMSKVYLPKITGAFAGKLVPQGIVDLDLKVDDAAKKTNAKFTLNLDRPVAAKIVEQRLRSVLTVQSIEPQGEAAASQYKVDVSVADVLPEDKLRAIVAGGLTELAAGAKLSDPTPESSYITGKVGQELRDSAILAVFWAMIGILIYLRVRFNDFIWGFAAIVACIHDLAICLAAMSVVHHLGIVDCEFDLVAIGSLMTLIGYSLNDTIVVYDRLRENLQRSPEKPFKEIIDISINQTLSRTIMTSMTVFIAVLVLFIVNYGQRNVLEGFAFIMLVGVVIGTYSSIYIASPLVEWLETRAKASKNSGTKGAPPAQAPAA